MSSRAGCGHVQVLLALYSGIFWGCFVMYKYNLVLAFKQSFSQFIVPSIADEEHAYVIIFSWILAGMVGFQQPKPAIVLGMREDSWQGRAQDCRSAINLVQCDDV